MITKLRLLILVSPKYSKIADNDAFCNALQIHPNDERFRPGTREGQTAKLTFAEITSSNSSYSIADSERFEAAVAGELLALAKWLSSTPKNLGVILREVDMTPTLHISIDMSQDQFELILPSELLVAAGERSLPVHMISNDF